MSSGPLPIFRFEVKFMQVGETGSAANKPICQGAFSEISGIEANLEAKAVRAGGQNYGDKQLPGRTTFGTVILKRGITFDRDLWQWFNYVAKGGTALRLDITVTQKNFVDKGKTLKWKFSNAVPIKYKAADYNATTGQIGIEELHFVHEKLEHIFS